MKTKPMAAGLAGIALFVAVVGASIWFFGGRATGPQELTLDEALVRIRSKQISDVTIRHSELEIEDRSKNKFRIELDSSDAAREAILSAAKETGARVTLEPAASGYFTFAAVAGLPFYLMWALTLAVVVWAVKVLSRNKS